MDVKVFPTKKNQERVFCVLKIKTLQDTLECKVFHDDYERNKLKLQIGQLINARGFISIWKDEPSIILNKIRRVK